MHPLRMALSYLHDWLEPQGDGAFPLIKFPRQVEQSVRQDLYGMPAADRQRAVYLAVKDVIFLFHVFQQANDAVLTHERAHLLLVAYLGELLRGCTRDTGKT